MKPILVLLFACVLCTPALAQEGRFVDPAPVNFDRPFQSDGVKTPFQPKGAGPALRNEDGSIRGVPIELWLANGRKMDGLDLREPKPAVNIEDGKALRKLFKDMLPVEAPREGAPESAR